MGNNRGIVIIAIGHEFYYKTARNLMATLRANDTIPITLLCDSLQLANKIDGSLNFDTIVIPDTVYKYKNQPEPVRAKMFLYDYSPYEQTLYLDADMAWLYKPVSLIFDQLKGVPFTIQNDGQKNAIRWGNVTQIRAAYNVPTEPLYELYAECIYFEKGKIAKKVFEAAKKIFDEPKVQTLPFAGGRVSDEFAFAVAMMKTEIYPHKEKWLPIMWPHRDKKENNKHPYQLSQLGYSIGGNSTPHFAKKKYMIIVNAAFAKIGLTQAWTPRDKRVLIPERNNI